MTRSELEQARSKVRQIELKMGVTNSSLSAFDGSMKLYIHGLVQLLGRHLNARQRVLSTAEVYLSRFFSRVSIHEVNLYVLVAACVYVACKTEEAPQHIRTVSSEARSIWPEYVTHDPTKIAECEFYLMEELDTYLIVHHPYRSLRELSKCLSDTVTLTGDEMQAAWSMINDSYATDLMLVYPPHVIAAASIYMTVVLRSPLARPSRPPERIKARIDQLVIFLGDSGIDLDHLAACVEEMIALYVRWESYDENGCRQLLKQQLLGARPG